MVNYETKITIDRPVSQVSQLFHNTEAMKQWLSGFKEIEIVQGLPGQVGTQSKLVFEINGKSEVFEEIITAYEENERFASTLEHKSFTSYITVNFTKKGPTDNSTEVVVSNKIEGKSFFWRIMLPLVKSKMKKTQEGDYQKFKVLAEMS